MDSAWMWAAIAIFLTALFALFRTFVVRELAWAYPADFDQSKYLWISYSTYESVLRNGLAAGLTQLFSTPQPNGVLIHLHALALMLLFGASRVTVLSVNFAALAAYLAIVAASVRALTGSSRMALLAVGLALGTGPQWFRLQTDYRLDFSSTCMFGIFVSLVMRSGVFRQRGWSLAAGTVAGLLVVSRFLTALYVAAIYLGLLVYFGLVCPWLLKRRQTNALQNVANVAASAALGAALSVPVVWLHGRAIYDYYVVQQSLESSVRAAEFSVTGALEAWLYYPKSLLFDHVGLPLVCASLLVLVVGAVRVWSKSRRRAARRVTSQWLTDACAFLALALVVIIGTLSANITRSPVVVIIAIPLFSWAIIVGAIAMLEAETERHEPAAFRHAALLAAAVLVLTAGAQVRFFGRHTSFWHNREDAREIVRMYRDIAGFADEVGWSRAVIASDSIRDYLLGANVTAMHYEGTGTLVTFLGVLGSSGTVTTPSAEAIEASLANADFMVLTHRSDTGEPPYPIVQTLNTIRPRMEAAASARMLRLGEYAIFGRLVHVYARPSVRMVDGVSGGWITSDGLLVEVPARLISLMPRDVMVSGAMNPWISPDLTVTCRSSSDGAAPELAGSFSVDQGAYVARCALPDDLTGTAPVRVRVSFSRFFVPREKGINDDARKLVLGAPVRMEVVPRRAETPQGR
jgi:hypothetical protein